LRPSPDAERASREVGLASEVVCRPAHSVSGSLQPSLGPVSEVEEGSLIGRPPSIARLTFLAAPPLRSPYASLPLGALRRRALPAQVRFLIAASLERSTVGADSRLRASCSVLRFSQPLDGLLPLKLAGFKARCHVQDSSVQGLLPPRSRPDSSPGLCPLAVRWFPRSPSARECPREKSSASRPRSAKRCVPAAFAAAARSPLRLSSFLGSAPRPS